MNLSLWIDAVSNMLWRLCVGDILDVPADVLVCSANVYLNLSGGVGGAFALRTRNFRP